MAGKRRDLTPRDWHPADIIRELKLRGLTQRKLSTDNALSPSAVSVALQKKWPKVERIIASTLGTRPEIIWPSRYASAMPIKSGSKEKSSGPIRGETLLNTRATQRFHSRPEKAA